jgi:malonyl-ACP decarboxylase
MNSNVLTSDKAVVVTGIGALSNLGNGVGPFRDGLQKGHRYFTHQSNFSELSFPVIAAALKNFNFENAINAFTEIDEETKTKVYRAGRRAPFVVQTSLIVAMEAYQQARLGKRDLPRNRIGLVIAGQNTTQRYCYDLQKSFDNNPDYLTPSYALHFMDTDQIGTLSEVFNIQGEGLTVGGASATGNIGIIQAYRMLQQGLIDICLVVGVLADLSPLEVQGFYNCGAMGGRRFVNEPMSSCRPFDKDHEGFIWGQASGCLVLESKNTIEGGEVIIKGVGIALDAHRHTDPNINGECRAMRNALTNAQLTADAIQYINTHGSSSVIGDEIELTAIREVFTDAVGNIWINATKGLIGHCLWSAGILEAIATIIQMQDNFVHSNANLEKPIDDRLRWVGASAESARINYALSNSFGFGGINSSIIFAKEGT